jgi:hypothetical protein
MPRTHGVRSPSMLKSKTGGMPRLTAFFVQADCDLEFCQLTANRRWFVSDVGKTDSEN